MLLFAFGCPQLSGPGLGLAVQRPVCSTLKHRASFSVSFQSRVPEDCAGAAPHLGRALSGAVRAQRGAGGGLLQDGGRVGGLEEGGLQIWCCRKAGPGSSGAGAPSDAGRHRGFGGHRCPLCTSELVCQEERNTASRKAKGPLRVLRPPQPPPLVPSHSRALPTPPPHPRPSRSTRLVSCPRPPVPRDTKGLASVSGPMDRPWCGALVSTERLCGKGSLTRALGSSLCSRERPLPSSEWRRRWGGIGRAQPSGGLQGPVDTSES